MTRGVVRLGRQRARPTSLQVATRAVRRDDQGCRVPGRAVLDGAGRRVDQHDAHRGGVRLGVQACVAVERLQRVRDRVVGQQPLVEYGAKLAHHGRGLDPLADGVAHDQGDRPVGAHDRVEPVASRARIVGRQQVRRRDVQGGSHREVSGQQGVLQVRHQLERCRVPRLGCLPRRRKGGDVGPAADAARDQPGLVTPWRDDEVGVDPLVRPARVHPPAVEVVRVGGAEHLLEELDHRLPQDPGQGVGQLFTGGIAAPQQASYARVGRQHAELGAGRDQLQVGTLLEPDGLGLGSVGDCHCPSPPIRHLEYLLPAPTQRYPSRPSNPGTARAVALARPGDGS